MNVVYKNKKLEKECSDYRLTKQRYGQNADKIHQRINELKALSDLEEGIRSGIGGLHVLKGGRKEQYAMSLIEPYRLIFIEESSALDTVKVIEIVDYHKKSKGKSR